MAMVCAGANDSRCARVPRVPPDRQHVCGLVVAVQNMLEQRCSSGRRSRDICADNDLGIVMVYSGARPDSG